MSSSPSPSPPQLKCSGAIRWRIARSSGHLEAGFLPGLIPLRCTPCFEISEWRASAHSGSTATELPRYGNRPEGAHRETAVSGRSLHHRGLADRQRRPQSLRQQCLAELDRRTPCGRPGDLARRGPAGATRHVIGAGRRARSIQGWLELTNPELLGGIASHHAGNDVLRHFGVGQPGDRLVSRHRIVLRIA